MRIKKLVPLILLGVFIIPLLVWAEENIWTQNGTGARRDTDEVVIGASSAGSAAYLRPGTNNTNDLGTSSYKWKDAYIAGNASVGGTLTVTGATTLSAGLSQTSAWTTLSTATFSKYIAVTGSSTLTGAVGVGSTLGVTGATTLSSTLGVSGAATLSTSTLNGSAILYSVAAPMGLLTPTAAGSMIFNSTGKYLCISSGTNNYSWCASSGGACGN